MTSNPPAPVATLNADTVIVLVVGHVTEIRQTDENPPAGVRFITADQIAETLARGAMPAIVLSPLSGPGFDAITIAQTLNDAGFRGVFYASTRPLPDPGLVTREVQRVAPDLVFDLLLPQDLAWFMRSVRR